MNPNLDSTYIPFPTPGDPAEASAGGDPKRGRKSGYAPKIIDMMCDKIRRFGLSDSAAAEHVGMSSSTVSRWKQLYPEIGPKLQQARQEIRIHHLEIIEQAAAAENGRGWRASAWILERLFPMDYARKISERFAALNLVDVLKDREDRAALEARLEELHAMQDAEREAARAAAAAEAEAEAARAREETATARPAAAGTGGEPASLPDGIPAVPRAETAAVYSEEGSHNSRNSEEAESANDEGRRTKDETIAGGACFAGAKVEDANGLTAEGDFLSESDSQNSRNGHLAPHAARPGSGGALSPSPSPLPTAHMPPPRPSRVAERTAACSIYSEADSHNSRNSCAPQW